MMIRYIIIVMIRIRLNVKCFLKKDKSIIVFLKFIIGLYSRKVRRVVGENVWEKDEVIKVFVFE